MINFSEINQFRLDVKEISDPIPDSRYSYSFVDDSTFEDNIEDLSKVIEFLHEDLVWDGIPTIEQVKQRLEFGSICALGKYDNICVGWAWLNNDYIAIDWVTPYKALKPNEQYIGGSFLHRASAPEPSASHKFYRLGIQTMYETFDKSILYLYSDTWNRASSILCTKVGFQKYDFL